MNEYHQLLVDLCAAALADVAECKARNDQLGTTWNRSRAFALQQAIELFDEYCTPSKVV